VTKLECDILAEWKKLTTEEKQKVLQRITMKASGIELEPLRLEELHPRTRRIEVLPTVKDAQ
jgi:predicted Fe-S protein YdhL (DUF1289 family)